VTVAGGKPDEAEHGPQDVLAGDTAEELYDAAPCGYLSTHPDGLLAKVNQTFLTWTGYQRDELVGRLRFLDLLAPGSRIYHETHYAPLLRMQGSVQEIAFDLVRADGTRFPVLVNSRLRNDDGGRPLLALTTVFDASDRKKYERELLLARRKAEQYAERLAILQLSVAELAAAAEVADVARVIVGVGRDAFGAAASALWLREESTGRFDWVAALGVPDPVGEPPFLTADAELPQHEAIQQGEVVVVQDAAEAGRAFPLVSAAFEGGPAGTLVLVPLVAQGRTLGVVASRFAERRDLDVDEVGLLQTVGRQAGLALQRARLFDEQRTVALTLQRSLLPHDAPTDPRLQLATCYLPSEDAMEVGGDWYDMFGLDADRVAVVVGDVVGRGVHAAAAMGQLRSAVRALAALDADPATLLGRLDRFVEGVEAAQMATLAFAELDLRDGSLRYACAGHPPPVLLGATGEARLLWGGRSAPLGAHFGAGHRSGGQVVLAPGDRLLLYTDGLVERRDRGLDVGIDLLAAEVATWGQAPLAAQVDAVTEAMLRDIETRDDVCLLGLSFREEPAFEDRIPADRREIATLRDRLAAWLHQRGVPEVERDTIVLACSEAVANAIEHAYDDDAAHQVEVMATVRDDQLLIRVSDAGRWRTERADGIRGRGLAIIRRVMDQVTIDRSAGTVVTMHRRIHPASGR
jgi:serine/threonine-protein kinase RsbW